MGVAADSAAARVWLFYAADAAEVGAVQASLGRLDVPADEIAAELRLREGYIQQLPQHTPSCWTHQQLVLTPSCGEAGLEKDAWHSADGSTSDEVGWYLKILLHRSHRFLASLVSKLSPGPAVESPAHSWSPKDYYDGPGINIMTTAITASIKV
jgi:hypothetical protein